MEKHLHPAREAPVKDDVTERIMGDTERFFSFFRSGDMVDPFLKITDGGDGWIMKWKKTLLAGAGSLLLFILWTILIQYVDVQAAGPMNTKVGFASWNVRFHQLTGVNWTLYTITDWLGLVPVFICGGFGILGLSQWIRRKRILRVDADILLLGVYYLLVIAGYLFFEMVPVNYRPVLIDGCLEASYPSSTTLLVLSVMPTLKLQADRRCGDQRIRSLAAVFSVLFSFFMVIGRLVSGVHWMTDIIGSVLLSAGLFLLYCAAVVYSDQKKNDVKRGRTDHGVS